MNKIIQTNLIASIIGIMVLSVPVASYAQVDDSGCCSSDVSSYDSTYTPSYDSTYTPSYDSTYTPSYDSFYSPSYTSSYTNSYVASPTYTAPSTSYTSPTYSIASGASVAYRPTVTTSSGVGYSTGYSSPIISYASTPTYSYPTYSSSYNNTQIVTQTCAQYGEYGTYPKCYTQTCPSGTFGTYPNCMTVNSQPAPAYSTPTTPVVINNTNTNTILPAQPQQIVQYVGTNYPSYYQSNLACSINASRTSITAGQATTLAWASNNAVRAVLTGMGAVSTTGTMSVNPSGTVDYVLTVYDQYGQSSTCDVNIVVGGYYNGGPSISLSQIPYTGFDFGTFGDMVYWFALGLFALSLGYLVVYMQGGVWKFATRTAKGYTPIKPVTFVESTPVARLAKTTHAAPISTSEKKGDSIKTEIVNGSPRLVITRN